MTEGHEPGVQDRVPEPDSSGVQDETVAEPVPEPAADYETSWTSVAALLAGGVAIALLWGWPVLLVIVGIAAIITIHELGHYLTAKWSGMKVTEFFIGFGPRLWSFRRGETEYGIKPIPAGAYVRIIGMSNLDEVDPVDEPRTYRQQSFPKRLLVVLAGPATHFVQALIIVFLLLTVAGMPGGQLAVDDPLEEWVVRDVVADSAAEDAGLEPGDRVLTFNGEPVDGWEEMSSLIRESDVGDEVTLGVQRDGEVFRTSTEIGRRPREEGGSDADAGSPFLGLGPKPAPNERLGVVDGLVQTPRQTVEISWGAVTALGSFFSPSGLDTFADSVREGSDEGTEGAPSTGAPADDGEDDSGRLLSIYGAVRVGAQLTEQGWAGLAMFYLSINIFVGLINLVPLLPFDGGHAAVAVYERIRSRGGRRYYADVTKLLPVAYAVIMGLVLLGITTIYLDIVDPVQL
ncbi:MAG: M50 family metallopeptidase [Acidimicrobiales bacterium]